MADNQEYSAALQDFAKSLQGLMASMVESVKNNSGQDSTEAVKKLATDMAESADVLETINKNTQETKTNSEEILAIVKSIKNERKKGIFDKLSGAKDKTKSLAEGIKTIALMAGAVLAIGMAFKVVSQVDFASVIALSVALPLMAIAFNQVGETVEDPKDAAMIGLSMVIMSAAVAVSGAVLSYMPNIGLMQLVSAVGVSVAMGVAMYGMALVADRLNTKEIGQMYLIAGVMPVMALGILLSANILQDVPQVDFLNAITTAAAVTGAGLIFGLAAAIMSKVSNPAQTIMGSLSMVAASGGLALSSHLIAMGDYSNYPTVDWAKGYGLAMLASLPAIIAFGALAATGVGVLVIGAGILSMLAVAGGLAAASHIVSEGNYTGGPSVEWSTSVGTAIMAFANAMDTLNPGLVDMFFSGDSLDQRIDMIKKLGSVLRDTSFDIAGGNYKGGPTKAWSEGVGLAIMAFANSMDSLEPGLIDTIFGGENLESRIGLMITLANNLPRIAAAINQGKGNYNVDNAPSKQWSEGVGTALMAFANAMGSLEPGILGMLTGDSLASRIQMMIPLARQLPLIAAEFNKYPGKYDVANVPSKAWSDGVGTGVTAFATAIATLADEIDLDEISTYIAAIMPLAPVMAMFGIQLSKGTYTNYPKKEWAQGIGEFFSVFSDLDIVDDAADQAKQMLMLANSYIKLAASMMVLGKGFNAIKEVPNLSGLYGGLVTLSLIDSDNLEDALDAINSKSSEFSKVMEMVQASNNVKIDESTFAFNKDKNNSNTSTQKSSVKITSSGGSTPTVNRPATTTTANKEKNLEILLEKMVKLLSSSNSVLHEIADNTDQKMGESGINH